MMTGLLLRLDRESAARYSFLMSIPVIGGAAAYKALEVAKDGLPAGTATPFLVGMVSAALSGLAAIWFVLAYLQAAQLQPLRALPHRRRRRPCSSSSSPACARAWASDWLVLLRRTAR